VANNEQQERRDPSYSRTSPTMINRDLACADFVFDRTTRHRGDENITCGLRGTKDEPSRK
jgi:hypothetical protein